MTSEMEKIMESLKATSEVLDEVTAKEEKGEAEVLDKYRLSMTLIHSLTAIAIDHFKHGESEKVLSSLDNVVALSQATINLELDDE